MDEALKYIETTYGEEEYKPFILTGADNTTQLLDENYNR